MAVNHFQVHSRPLPRLFPPEGVVATALVSVCVVTRQKAWVKHLTGLRRGTALSLAVRRGSALVQVAQELLALQLFVLGISLGFSTQLPLTVYQQEETGVAYHFIYFEDFSENTSSCCHLPSQDGFPTFPSILSYVCFHSPSLPSFHLLVESPRVDHHPFPPGFAMFCLFPFGIFLSFLIISLPFLLSL